ncbi:MAG: hypothetical protein ACI4L9_01395 [Candidatus Coproplasma sp.]
MAKRRTTQTTERRDMVKTCAFWGLAISAVMYVVGGIIAFVAKYTGSVGAILNQISSILSLLASLGLLVAIALPAYGYVRGKKRAWKIFYWIALIIYVLGVVFGMLPRFI